MYINGMSANTFVAQLSKEKQEKIKQIVIEYLTIEGYDNDKIEETIENVMDDRLWNIEQIIDINLFIT
jgi:ribosomal protein S13